MPERAERPIDFAWFRRMVTDDLGPRWLEAAPRAGGVFHTELDRRWQPRGETTATLVSQSRLLFVFAQAYRLTGERAYLEAIRAGADFLLRHFRDGERGGWFWQVDAHGLVTDDHKDCYGHAFVVLGLSHAYMATGDGDHLAGARDANETIHTRFADGAGGLARKMTRNFEDRDEKRRTQDPIMHFVEALLAQSEIPGQDEALRQAQRWTEFLLSRMRAAGDDMLAEDYTFGWEIMRLPSGKPSICPGHLPEWAFFLSHSAEKGLSPEYAGVGKMLLDSVLRESLDGEQGCLRRNGRIGWETNETIGWWDQCETLRALGHYIVRRGCREYLPVFNGMVDYVRRSFIDPEYGGWYTEAHRDGTVRCDHKGELWKTDYHTVAMCMEMVRVESFAGEKA